MFQYKLKSLTLLGAHQAVAGFSNAWRSYNMLYGNTVIQSFASESLRLYIGVSQQRKPPV